jgi:hypothetical protein
MKIFHAKAAKHYYAKGAKGYKIVNHSMSIIFQSFAIKIHEPSLKSIFVAKLCVVLNFRILINSKLTPVQKFKTP